MMRFGNKITAIIGVLLLAFTTPLEAREVLNVPATARWKHAATGLILNPVLAGLNRTEIATTAPMELDVQAHYEISSGATFATVYIFRPGAGDLAIWFDRANASLAASDKWVIQSTLESGPAALPVGEATGAFKAVYATGGGSIRSTAVMLVPMGEWIAKIRLSSQTEEADALSELMTAIARQITWPEATRLAAAAAPVQPCAKAIAFGKSARPVGADSNRRLGNALLDALMSSIEPDTDEPRPSQGHVWCRDSVVGAHAVYRQADGEDDSYMLALSDAGRAIVVRPALNLLDAGESRRTRFAVALHQLDRIFSYRNFDRMVPPQQALEIIEKERPVSSVSTTGSDKTITLGGGAR